MAGMNYNDDEFKQTVALRYNPGTDPLLEWSGIAVAYYKALLAAMDKIEALQKQVGDSRIYAQGFAACLSDKDKALKTWRVPLACYCKHIDDRWVECEDHVDLENSIALNPNQYQERVMARDRVIEAAKLPCRCGEYGDEHDSKTCRTGRALAELDKLEGNGK
jgi:hypothetical protein